MRILLVVHHHNAAIGVFADPAIDAGHELVEWLPQEQPEAPDLDGFDAVFVFGAEAQVDEEDKHAWLRPEKEFMRDLLGRDKPVLGVCFGSQLIAEVSGGVVRRAAAPEIGWHPIELTPQGRTDPILGFLPERFEGFGYHHYEWLLPPDAVALAASPATLQAFRLSGRPVWGLQFHPEVTLADLSSWLDNWENDAWALETDLDPEAIKAESAAKIGAWNEIGRRISERFLAVAAGEAAPELRSVN